MFVDEAEIFVKAGDGGDGCVSFRREKYVPAGGPDGGDGGRGGEVVAVADPRMRTLLDFLSRTHYRAENGRRGSGKRKTGRTGEGLELRLPVGTIIYHEARVLTDLAQPGQRVILAGGDEADAATLALPARPGRHLASQKRESRAENAG